MNRRNTLFTSESVSEGHPDKVADQISDAILDEFLRQDPESKVACETFCTAGLVVVGGEVRSDHAYVDIPAVARRVIGRIGYNKAEYGFDASSCGVISTIHEQSADINRGVVRSLPEEQGAGDQGMMFGYACSETETKMPLSIDIANRIVRTLSDIRNEGSLMCYMRPDSKSQVTVEYGEDGKPRRIHTIVVSLQHDEFGEDSSMHRQIERDVKSIVLQRVTGSLPAHEAAMLDKDTEVLVNPTGRFVIGGPAGDTGLTGRKIIVDTYGGYGAHGGGAFSGKDPSKVDRSAAYAARHIAKNAVSAGLADEMLIQVAYAIGKARPVSFCIDTYGTSRLGLSDYEIAARLEEMFDMRPSAIISNLSLKNPIYEVTASFGHFGRESYVLNVIKDGEDAVETRCFFPWEKLDMVDKIIDSFGI